MEFQRDVPAGEQHDRHGLTAAPEIRSYLLLTDEQLTIERDRLRELLEEFTTARGVSEVDCQLLVDIELQIDEIMDELLQRARSRHPSAGGLSARFRLRPALQGGE